MSLAQLKSELTKLLNLIRRGDKAVRSAAALPQSTSGAIFTVTGGDIAVKAIVGKVTTAVQDQANASKIQFKPTGGELADLCAATDIADSAVGTRLYISNEGSLGTSASIAMHLLTPLQLGPGEIHFTCAASNTGQVEWTLLYEPMDDTAVVAAA